MVVRLETVVLLFSSLYFFHTVCALSPIVNLEVPPSSTLVHSATGPDGTVSILTLENITIFANVYDKLGNYKWRSNYTTNPSYFEHLPFLTEVGHDRCVYVHGVFDTATNFGGGFRETINFNTSTGFIVKYSQEGNYLWDVTMPLPLIQYYDYLKEDPVKGLVYLAGTDPANDFFGKAYNYGVFALAFNIDNGTEENVTFVESIDAATLRLKGFDVLNGKILLGIEAHIDILFSCESAVSNVGYRLPIVYVGEYSGQNCINIAPIANVSTLGGLSYGSQDTFTALTYGLSGGSATVNIAQYHLSNGTNRWGYLYLLTTQYDYYVYSMDTSPTNGNTVLYGFFKNSIAVQRALKSPKTLTIFDYNGFPTYYYDQMIGVRPYSVAFANDSTLLFTGGYEYIEEAQSELLSVRFDIVNTKFFALRAMLGGPSVNFCQSKNQTSCPDGRCVASLSECLCLGSQGFRCFDGSCMSECPKAPYELIPLEVILEVPVQNSFTTTILSPDKFVVGYIEAAPNAFVTSDNTPTVNLTVKGVSPLELLSVKLLDGSAPDGLRHVLSSVVEFEISPNVVQPFASPVNITLRVTLPPNFSLSNYNFCLAFINNSRWECVSELVTSDNITFTGFTSHFTPFSVLFTGRSESEDHPEDEVIGGDSNKDEGVPVKVVVPIVVCVFVAVVAIIVVGVILNNKRKKRLRQGFQKKAELLTKNDATNA